MFPDHWVSSSRQGEGIVNANAHVQIEWLSVEERRTAQGGVIMGLLFDDPESPNEWRQGDYFTITAIDGTSRVPETTQYGINLVTVEALLPLVICEIVGGYQ